MSVWDAFEGARTVEGVARQVASDSRAHAWLLLGPGGSGKRAVALAMAAALNCPEEPGIGCGVCRSCARILRGRHPDVHHVAPEGPLIPVDVVRDQINPEASRSPFEGRIKVFVIEEADRMNPAAQNALLKTVEEPQPDTVFILISDNEDEVLETLRSRCRIVRLEALSVLRMSDVLVREGATEPVAEIAARASFGDLEIARALAFDESTRARRKTWASLAPRLSSPLAALEAATQVMEEARAAVKEREEAQKAEVIELSEAMGEGRGTAGARNALAKRHRRELKRLEEDVLGEALTYLASYLRDVVALRGGARQVIANLDAEEALEGWARGEATDAALLAASERCLEARASFAFNANPTLAMESTLVEVASSRIFHR